MIIGGLAPPPPPPPPPPPSRRHQHRHYHATAAISPPYVPLFVFPTSHTAHRGSDTVFDGHASPCLMPAQDLRQRPSAQRILGWLADRPKGHVAAADAVHRATAVADSAGAVAAAAAGGGRGGGGLPGMPAPRRSAAGTTKRVEYCLHALFWWCCSALHAGLPRTACVVGLLPPALVRWFIGSWLMVSLWVGWFILG